MPSLCKVVLKRWLTHQIIGVDLEKNDHSGKTCYADAVPKRLDVSKSIREGLNASGRMTYKDPILNEIANPIFLEVEACNLQIIGSGRNRTVTTVTVLVSEHVK